MNKPYDIFPLGDSALTIDFGNVIDVNINKHVISLHEYFSNDPFPSMLESVPTYGALTIYYDPCELQKLASEQQTIYDWMSQQVENQLEKKIEMSERNYSFVTIPVCYDEEYAPDLAEMSDQRNLSKDYIVQLHTAISYRVYMLGFLPGFAYMGLVSEEIAIARKLHPRHLVEAGSVGIAGRQTGIYPLQSPGGWNIIGRTPLNIIDLKSDHPTLLRAGDMVRFKAISREEFKQILVEKL